MARQVVGGLDPGHFLSVEDMELRHKVFRMLMGAGVEMDFVAELVRIVGNGAAAVPAEQAAHAGRGFVNRRRLAGEPADSPNILALFLTGRRPVHSDKHLLRAEDVEHRQCW